ncbi:MAG: sigma-54 dependent transcriptional regulator [Acidobacteria bacterium]|nr:sigma-54 dependent transcriptional regulator [Acidobacteriota bacterium]
MLRRVLDVAARIATSDATVLVEGESGTGKDLLAKTIHQAGPRSQGPFVAVAPASISPELFESELFGFEKGAFTDARERKPGRVESAHGGTLYLDEVGVTPPEVQPKLLRFVQDGEFTRIGGWADLRVDARIIASSSQSLEALVDQGGFRKDLLYRLNVVTLELPPLRHRSEDIPLLAARFAAEHADSSFTISDEAMDLLVGLEWKGNVRELSNVVRRAVLTASGPVLKPEDFDIRREPASLVAEASEESWPLEKLEEAYIREILRRTRNNFSTSARILGINRKTLLEKRRRYGIDEAGDDG